MASCSNRAQTPQEHLTITLTLYKQAETCSQIHSILITLKLYNFKFYFTLLSKNFSPFLHSTCLLSVSNAIFSFGRSLPPRFILYYQTILLRNEHSIKSLRTSLYRTVTFSSFYKRTVLFEHKD